MQNKPTKMESGLIELIKESALGSQRYIRSLKKSPLSIQKTWWPDHPIPQLERIFFSNKNLG